ncbi:MAG: CDP-alcohol phosphatidyltransferase family protein [Bacteroidia bacterium]
MNKIRRNIPNAITCGNLLCGCLALVKAFEGDLVWAAYLVGIACVFDFFDGFMARLLGVSSPIGKDLDSLADMVTFGVVPGVVMYKLLHLSVGGEEMVDAGWHTTIYPLAPLSYVAFMITIFSAIRLAKFNNDTRQSESFIGLPTPANAIFLCSLPLISDQIMSKINQNNPFEILVDFSSNPVLATLNNPWVLIITTIIFSLLLVSPLPLFSLKFKSFGWKGNEIRFVFLGLAVIMLALLQFVGIPLVIILYILMSAVNNFMSRSKKSVE